ncbi:hypothetical protein LEP1GSC036_1020 [Leptospira weilii str. 2006001853]|uniref:Uncharacterized protein n=1 Tax=Leptospira weilii str. 2006001853 TaxID=1001589 RepID=A0A828Z326_9LEPT|nr:hypothetical protein [Leptospira weilii]EKR62495.1 hypothetical protein LEP1GSC036_1723 [Leptospira weilii str. 2006001853]EKR64680.1 hypothetical protein LEP1GSC036_3403 [Leptospira weilii str. 2006001853]EKR66195.1 hypothetical protein LEP1GSC036_1020 [Leptospira weilii str. 2006001853]QDK22950.1 hypothetical protein FHG67_09665 [Leptospira weilii]QDK27405.1 hypothetical protein FHG68_12565 [Leptospira weilii]
MPAVIEDNTNLDELIKGLEYIESATITVGLVGSVDSDLLVIAGAQEFGAVIRPKNSKWLTIPLHPELKGKSPRSIPGLKFIPPRKGKSAFLAKVEGGKLEPLFILTKKVVIPERSWLRGTFDLQSFQNAVMEEFETGISNFLNGVLEAEQVLHRVGLRAVSEIKNRIVNNDPPFKSLSGLTSSLKGNANPLRDNLRFFNAINYAINGEVAA